MSYWSRASLCLVLFSGVAFGLGQQQYIETAASPGSFAIVAGGVASSLYVDAADYPGVARAASDLQSDIARVTGVTPAVMHDTKELGASAIIVGTVGKSPVIDALIRSGKLNVTAIAGKWESFLIQVVPQPLPGVASALVIAGSDKRGTIYGIYDVSEQIGVSPWYWWADVPVQHKDALFVKPGAYLQGPPAVKYRGIFLNDEAPSLSGWVHEKYGNYNHEFYTKVFELLLRLKANYLWPAMWNNAFNEDDPLNPKLADEYGIVMGTSHHEPMLRAQQEWKRHGTGPWDYSANSAELNNFWTEGIERNKNYESVITLGMRGDGDMPMSESANVALLEKIVADQRAILANHMNKNLSEIPQDWALYKEVQEYYEKGMRVPDDVTLLWCDDNWGNIRRLPTPDERKRSGGAGIYYHFDYVGDPRSYKWLNTVPITKVWEQMNLAYEYGADRIWIVNVGDLKPMEFPIEFFLTFAWDRHRWPKEAIGDYTRMWAEREFGPVYATEIAHIVSQYTKLNGRRKPELIDPDTFSQVNYEEADRVLAEWQSLVDEAEKIYATLPQNQRDAFYELVLYPTKASALVTEIYITAGKNHLYALQGRASANDVAAQVRTLFQADAGLSAEYNHKLAGGKWHHMMDQTHIGYTSWQEPPKNVMPEVRETKVLSGPHMGVAVEGSLATSPDALDYPPLLSFDVFNQQQHYIDVYNAGNAPVDFSATASAPWIVVSPPNGTIAKDQRLWVTIDWDKAPSGASEGTVTINGSDWRRSEQSGHRLQTVTADAQFTPRLRRIRRLRLHRSRALHQEDRYPASQLAENRRLRTHALVPVDLSCHCEKRNSARRLALSRIPNVSISARQARGRSHTCADIELRSRTRPALRHLLRRPPSANHRRPGEQYSTRLGAVRRRQRAQGEVNPHRRRRRLSHLESVDGRSRSRAAETGRRSRRRQAQLSRAAGKLP